MPEGHRGARAAVLERHAGARRCAPASACWWPPTATRCGRWSSTSTASATTTSSALNIPNGIPLVYELDGGAEADSRDATSAIRRLRPASGSAAVAEPGQGLSEAALRPRACGGEAQPAPQCGARGPLQRLRDVVVQRCASARRSACALARAGSTFTCTCTPRAGDGPHAVHQRRRAQPADRAGSSRARARCSAAPPAAPATAVAIAACSRLAWNGSSARPSPVVPSGNTATISPARSGLGDLVHHPQRIALALALDEQRAAPRRSTSPAAASARTSDLETKRARGHTACKRQDVEPRHMVGHQQRWRRRANPACRLECARRSHAAGHCDHQPMRAGAAAPSSAGKRNATMAMPCNTCSTTRSRRHRPTQHSARQASARAPGPRGHDSAASWDTPPASTVTRTRPGNAVPVAAKSNGVCLPWLVSASARHLPAWRRIEHAEVGDAAFDQAARAARPARPALAPSTRTGSLVTRASVRARLDAVVLPHLQRQAQQQLEPRSHRARPRRTAGSSHRRPTGVVIGHQRIDRAVGQRTAQRVAVGAAGAAAGSGACRR